MKGREDTPPPLLGASHAGERRFTPERNDCWGVYRFLRINIKKIRFFEASKMG